MEGLVKRFHQTEVVKGIDLGVEEGEFIVLLGPSGCGKTTTLRMIAGFIEPNSGTIRIGGEVVNRLPPRARNVGMVFQDYALFPNMTVADNIGFGLVERRAPAARIKTRVAEMLSLIRMEGFGDRYPGQLSGGQQQRVALARSLAYEPRVLLMDEPLGALDQKLREEMQREFARIQRSLAITTVFVTHDQQEAMALADRVVVMNRGRIEQCGRPEELYRTPKTLFIAEFVGRSNKLAGVVQGRTDDRVTVRSAAGDLIEGLAMEDLAAAQHAVCVVRPERLAIAARGSPASGQNRIGATVRRCSFFGSSIDVVLALRNGEELVVQAPADASRLPGEEVDVVFAAADTMCFAAPRDV